ncbi:rod shape-determining protein MreC [Algoriphagus hitonicola]|uniref:Cell shape-determining protein MreC n=1 Tax=Algoriphagus hitonicola TaxID=435880 RepID=A0A1I2S2H4_9BACT|nr:rod shape-determining protein MreC [Algoriphagus hitonicola]SFG45037.1 rod shape-determining protein MreC [Algoriphagus hitonicola]
MLRILQFLYSLRAFLLFLLLELVAIWLIVSNNSPQGAAFFNSSNAVFGSVLKTQSDISDFLDLAEANEELLRQNAELLARLEVVEINRDSTDNQPLDSNFVAEHEFKSARVIAQTLRYAQNHLTLDKGKSHGVKPGMGVFNHSGIVGRVKTVSENYSVAISVLNTGLLISSKIKPSGVYGSINWDGQNTTEVKMLYIPRHVEAQAGDTVVTSGYNAIFPEGIAVGVIKKVEQGSNQNYLDIVVELSTDFSKINYVYLVENNQIEERDTLNQEAEIVNEY